MIFSELYSAYYNTVANILASLLEGENREKDLQQIVSEKAFGESGLTILPALKREKWQLVRPDMTTPLVHKPTMPLTLLQKRWLKAISLDPRVKLFDVEWKGLEEIEPLFTSRDYCLYDQYGDGDPFEDAGYMERFRMILTAIKERRPLRVELINRHGQRTRWQGIPVRLEYSEKDDKFRMITVGSRYGRTINLGRIIACGYACGGTVSDDPPTRSEVKRVSMTVVDERNALERAMLHFAHFEKQAERLGGDRYRLTVRYDRDDETELVIRILSFGPMVKVEEPQSFVDLIKDRLLRQKTCQLK